jgi:hypothetical protein
MRRRRTGAALAAAVLAIALSACGGDDSDGGDAGGSEEMTAEGAESAVVEILSSTDPESCQRMTDAYIEALYFESGAAGVKACEQSVSENQLTDVTVAGVSVEGETATGTVSTVLGPADFSAVYVDGEWKLDSFTASGQ